MLGAVVVWRLDRLGRSLPHLIETVRDLEARGVRFKSVQESIDTTTPGGLPDSLGLVHGFVLGHPGSAAHRVGPTPSPREDRGAP